MYSRVALFMEVAFKTARTDLLKSEKPGLDVLCISYL